MDKFVTDAVGWFPTLEAGFIVTLQLSALTACFAIVLSALLAVLSISPSRVLRGLASAYVELFRSIPILALLIFFYYGLGPQLDRIGLSAFWLAVGGLTLIESAYLCEIYRGALQAIGTSQWNAGASLGLGWASTLRLVILPQALPSALPGTVNMTIAIIKDSSLASLVAVSEITLAATQLVSETFQPVPIFVLLAMFYMALIIPFSLVGHAVERFVAHRLGLSDMARLNEPSASLVGRVVAGLGGRWI